jgi:two-component system, chemotaxis family, sensor kinase CheA
MASLEELKRTFFDECSELLQEMETGLTDLQEGSGSEDTVHAVFRAVHSIKGGAGIFGFEALVEFAHVFETVLDSVRHGTLNPTPEVFTVLLMSSDMLSDLVGMSRSGEAIPAGHASECRQALEQLIGKGKPAASDGGEDAGDFEGLDFKPVPAGGDDAGDFDFTPVPSDDFDGQVDDGKKSFTITFRPRPEMLRNANEPLYILRELRGLGELSLVTDLSALPPLSDIQPDQPYVSWSGTLRTDAARKAIDDVFEFVVGDCDLSIVEDQPSPPPVMEAAPPPDAHEGTPAASASAPVAESKKPERSQPAAEHPEGGKDSRASANNKKQATTTRVDLDKIDRVVNMVGELIIAQAMLGQVVDGLSEEINGRLSQVLDQVILHTRELKESVMSMRAQPVGSVFQRMPRLVRELSMKTGKKVRLEMSGESTEVDRTIVERLADPLTHIIRNSADHGIEMPEDRLASGKSEEGTIHLSAAQRGGRIVIEIKDDGAGINTERVLRKAKEKNLVDPDVSLTDDEICNLIFLPGFSTADTISDISGRGVGMDVVRRNIQDLGGRVSLKSERGKGMTIQLALPLTLAVMDGMVIKVGENIYVMPMSSIVECLHPGSSEAYNLLNTRGMLKLRGELVQLVYLSDLFDVKSNVQGISESVVIITEAGDGAKFGLVVDELCGHQQVVIKSIEDSYGQVPGIAAATIFGNGKVALILDVEKLSELSAEGTMPANAAQAATAMAIGTATTH